MATNEEVLKLYDEAIDFVDGEYDPMANRSHVQEEFAYNKVLKAQLKLLGEEISIADLGCGIGMPLVLLPERVLKKINYTGYDLNPRMLDIARQKYQKYSNMKWAVYDIRTKKLPAPADLIIANESLLYVPESELLQLIDYYYGEARLCLTVSMVYKYPRDEELKLTKYDMSKLVGKMVRKYPNAVITRIPEDFLRISVYKQDIYSTILEG